MSGITVALHHVTHYRYSRDVTLGMQTVRLRPAPHTRSVIQSYSLSLAPLKHFVNWQQDPFGNYLARIVFPEKTADLRVEVDLLTEIRAFNPFDFFLEDYAKDFPFSYEPSLKEELAPYLEIKENGPELAQWLKSVDRMKRSVVEFLVGINQKTFEAFRYLVRLDPGIQTPEETLLCGQGSCRDMAWLLCQALRHLGFATRFASGYLIQLKQDADLLGESEGPKQDVADLHAWTEVYLPGAGWIGLDSTSGLFTGEGHIPLCCTPNPSSAAPVSGTVEPCETTLEFTMEVTRVTESPRMTSPFTQRQWREIDALGNAIDAELSSGDVRLTMGGEPTFISDEDRIGEEWHYTALSAHKKKLGQVLFARLCKRFSNGGIAQYTQGKWYPGEILPRWAKSCIWRKDGEPLWTDETLLAEPEDAQKQAPDAATFLKELAKALGLPADYILPAYEDGAYHAWKEQTLPLESEANAFEQKEHERLQRLKDRIELPSGYILPLHFSYLRKRWITNRWRFGAGRLTLHPGDSPAGLRLPLGSLPYVKASDKDVWPERNLKDKHRALPAHAMAVKASGARISQKTEDLFADEPSGMVKRALGTEVRDGVLYIFLPPLDYFEHFIDLLACIEAVASRVRQPVVLEGYSPPADVRVQSFSVTPDPGVIEVNIHPAASWEELKTITHLVYEEAKHTKLSAEKFTLDGKRVGTGGGNHIVVGAAYPEESPFLRRPDLLKSMLAFWQNHPSLSYLFSSQYIGPTSQSPRIDEARHDSLYELEIAFRQIRSEPLIPSQIDRLFRNILVDVTGNTHRAEFCIDKLFSPQGGRGRLGLLEMRAFEMTPHPQMNLLQSLLIRGAIARFWHTPYERPLIRWGTRLHDRFLLPTYLKRDLHEALSQLGGDGAWKPEWFEPFFAFRFPECGKVEIGDVTLELRMALEPWPVLGEETSAMGVSRTVDSSLERLEVTVKGMLENRHIVTCNGRRLPLQPGGEHNSQVAGVRYKAWKLYSSLQPDLPVNAPLVFDLIDSELGRSLGGCVYHVVHPGGRNYESVPINDNEAEGRRLSRFEAMGHRPGSLEIPSMESNPEFPHTLDLRYIPLG